MKYVVYAIVVMILLCSITISSADKKIKGAGAQSCGEWTKSREKNTNLYNLQLQWVLGFISSYNVLSDKNDNPNGVWGNTDEKSIMIWLDNYCKENRLDSVGEAAVQLYTDMLERLILGKAR